MAAEHVVVDTHVLLWWLGEPSRLSKRARDAMDRVGQVSVSSVSIWEAGMLAAKGRIQLDRPIAQWTYDVVASSQITDAPVRAPIAAQAATLDDFHGDPADRLIVATALALDATLVTKDRRIRNWARAGGRLHTTW